MKQQVLVIGGGTSFATYRSYINFLKTKEVALDNLRVNYDWKDTLEQKLGIKYQVLQPRMPNKTNARYKEWKIWLERIIPLLNENIILVGHSLGGMFLAKYLSESLFPKNVKATILIAAPYDSHSKSLADFKPSSKLVNFANQSKLIYFLHSKDDKVVSFEDLGKYKKMLPSARTMIFKERGHFNGEAFPEIVRLIKSLK